MSELWLRVPSSLPMIHLLAKRGYKKHLCIRYSEFEPLSAAILVKEFAQWAWVDTFSGLPPNEKDLKKLKRHFRLCLVSPELQGYKKEKIESFKKCLSYVNAVCTKYPELWRIGLPKAELLNPSI